MIFLICLSQKLKNHMSNLEEYLKKRNEMFDRIVHKAVRNGWKKHLFQRQPVTITHRESEPAFKFWFVKIGVRFSVWPIRIEGVKGSSNYRTYLEVIFDKKFAQAFFEKDYDIEYAYWPKGLNPWGGIIPKVVGDHGIVETWQFKLQECVLSDDYLLYYFKNL